VGREILPHERDLRIWLRRRVRDAADVEDVVQECYCRFAQLADPSQVTNPRAYLFTMAANLVKRQWRHARIVPIEAAVDSAAAQWESELPSPERIVAARQELGRVQAALATLSERARRIFLLRRIEGLSQKEIARVLGVTETIVENEASRSLRTLVRLLTDEPAAIPGNARTAHARSR